MQSVSRFDEPMEESIVPVSIITQPMIVNSGARQLKDLLIQYVPGFTFVQDQNEVNVAQRGVYSSAQQKILILLEGHRLNSHVISAANPDFSIDLNKVDRIEVIRGPGSSVYGNVALTAVINIVLKQPTEAGVGQFYVAGGNYGQRHIAANYGQVFDNGLSLFAWASGYQSDGEGHLITPENDYARQPASDPVVSIISGFRDNPAHDIGSKISWGNWSLLLNHRRAHYIEPFTSASLTGEAYRYDDYPLTDGIGPGFQYTFTHVELAHDITINENVTWKNKVSYDRSDQEALFVLNPAIRLFGLAAMYDKTMSFDSGLLIKQQNNQYVLGYQYLNMDVYDSKFPFGVNGEYVGELYDDDNPLVVPGEEDTHSLYANAKLRLTKNWIGNLGFRYDKKQRLTVPDIKEFSPRLGVIYRPSSEYQLKLSYSESYVDPPYWNRYGALPAFRGSVDLKPEKLNSVQITPVWQFMDDTASVQVNVFYNEHKDFVFRNNLAGPDEPINTNSGRFTTLGVEPEFTYFGDNWQFRLQGFWHRVQDAEMFVARRDEIYAIPSKTLTFTWDHQWSEHITSQLSTKYLASRLTPVSIQLNGQLIEDPFPDSGAVYQQSDHRLPNEVISNFTFSWHRLFSDHDRVQFNIYNLFDVEYYEGGTTLHPYRQEGRWWKLEWRTQF
ncbi:MAG: TonB-dependent receptor plug domain-containing protein [Aestuariibacter sp.]